MKDIVNQPNQERAQAEQGAMRCASLGNPPSVRQHLARIAARFDVDGKPFRYSLAMLRDRRPENSGSTPLRGGV